MAANCESCGQNLPSNKRYTLSPSLVSALGKVYAAGGHRLKRADLKLTNVEYSNFRKLTYWGLIENTPGTAQLWDITPLGLDFFEGRKRIPIGVVAKGGHVLYSEGELVGPNDALPHYLEQVAA